MAIHTITSSVLSDDTWVHSYRGREALARPFRFEVNVVVPQANDLDLGEAIGAKVKLRTETAEGKPPMQWHGVIAAAKLVHQWSESGLFRLTVVPPLWLLGLSRHSRVFTKMKVPDILSTVLEDGGLASSDFKLQLTGSYDVEEHVAQYQESDLDFVHRWIEMLGIYYFFEHDDGGSLLVFADQKSAHAPLGPSPVRYHPVIGSDVTAAGDHFDRWTADHALQVASVKLYDYDYMKPQLDLVSQADVSPTGVGELNEHAGRVFTPAAAAKLATVRKEEIACREVVHHAEGNALYQRPGYVTELEDHPVSDLNTEYLVVEAEHAAIEPLAGAELDTVLGGDLRSDRALYRVRVTAVPASTQWRPRRTTRWPRVWGYEMATIDGPADDDYAQIDDQGRYAVKLRFDESELKDGKASTWLRMQQPHGGSVEGFHFPLRKATEVMVTFQGGDPDRPVIAAVLNNAHTPSPVTSANHTTNIIQTGGMNRIEMEDLDGGQRVTYFSPTKNSMLRMGAPNDDANMLFFTEGIGCLWVGGRFDWHTGGDKDETVEDAVTEIFTGPFTTTVTDGDTTEEYMATKNETVMGALTEDYRDTMTVTVTGPVDETFGSQKTLVFGQRSETLQGTVAKAYTGPLTDHVGGNVTETFQAGYDLTAGPSFTSAMSSSVTEQFGQYQTVTSAWTQVARGTRFNLTVGATQEFILGIKNENIMGIKTETVPGMAMSLVFALKIGLHASVKYENKPFKTKTFGAGLRAYGVHLKRATMRMKTKGINMVNAGLHIKK